MTIQNLVYPESSKQIQPKLLPLAFFVVLYPCTDTRISGFLEYLMCSVKYMRLFSKPYVLNFIQTKEEFHESVVLKSNIITQDGILTSLTSCQNPHLNKMPRAALPCCWSN